MSKEFKKPDVKAPRFRPKVDTNLNKEFYDEFKKKFKKYEGYENSTVKKVIEAFNTLVWQTVIETRDGVELPESLGWLFIGTCDSPKKENIDYAKSKKYGVVVTNKNWETDGKLGKIFYTNYANKYKFKNREFWGFVACRTFKRTVAATFAENWENYTRIVPTKKMKQSYDKARYKEYLKKRDEKALKTYKDFDI